MNKLLSSLLLFFAAALSAAAQEMPVIDIVYNGETAIVTIPDGITDVIDQSAGSSHVRLMSTTTTTEYAYRISGKTDNGSLYLSGSYKLTLELAGVSITNPSVPNNGGYAIDCEVGKRIAVVADEGTDNVFADAPSGAQKAALYFKGHPEFEGGGSITVTGNSKHAVSAKEYLQLKKTFGTLHILGAVSDGIHCGKGTYALNADDATAENNYFRMAGGNVVIENVGGDAIDTDDYGNVTISGGTLTFDVTGFDAKGIKCDNRLLISGGTINYTVSGDDAVGIQANNQLVITGGDITATVSGNGSKAMKANNKTDGFFPEGGYATIGNADGTGPNISITLTGGVYTDAEGSDSRCTALTVDRDLTLTGGSLYVDVQNPEARPVKVDGALTQTGGSIVTNGAYYSVRESDFRYDMRLYASVAIDDALVDPTTAGEAGKVRYQLAAYVGDECRGVASPIFNSVGQYVCFYLPVYSNAESGETLSFRIYDTQTGTEYTAAETLSFTSDAGQGQPSSPLALTFSTAVDPASIGLVARTIDRALQGNATLSEINTLVGRLLNGE